MAQRRELNEQRFLVLSALAGGPRHGYGLVADIFEMTSGRHRPRPGALYHGLDKMLDQGLVSIEREEAVDGRLRRTYAITAAGREVLTSAARDRQHDAATALDRLGLAGT